MIKVLRAALAAICLIALVLFMSCGGTRERSRASDVPLTQLEKSYGRLVAVANAPTPGQHGTGDRLGLFQDENGTIWGIPLIIGENNSITGCAPSDLRELLVTDTLPSDMSEIVGTTNEPSGWRSGTGRLEIVFRDSQGALRWHPVSSAELNNPSLCMTESSPRTPSRFYRLARAASK